MTVVIHCDASTKNGYSSWAYKSCIEEKPVCGVIRSTNSAGAELLAVIKALERYKGEEKILIISDCLVVVQMVQGYVVPDVPTYCHKRARYFTRLRFRLEHLLSTREVDAIWVASKNPNATHREIDAVAKAVLNEYLAI